MTAWLVTLTAVYDGEPRCRREYAFAMRMLIAQHAPGATLFIGKMSLIC